MSDNENAKPNTVYTVTAGTDIHEVSDRAEAVKLAKELSRESHQRVNVDSSDGMVAMQFSNGSLDSYVYETRDRRS
jgi:hypothetical protein